MPLQLGRAIGRGVRRALNPTGGVLMLLTAVYLVVFVGALNTLIAAAFPPELRQQASFDLTFPISGALAGVLIVVGLLFGFVIYLAAARAFTRDPNKHPRFSTDLFTRRIGRALVSAIGANIIVSVAVTIGFILLIIPGLYLSVSFVFVVFAIGVEDARALDALRRSWELASGHRWRLLALVLVIGIGTSLFSSIGTAVAFVDPVLGQLVSLVLTAPISVLSYGILAEAYIQVRDEAADTTTAAPAP